MSGLGKLEVKRHPRKGRAVHATAAIRAGELIDEAPVVIIPVADCATVERTVLAGYYFDWDGVRGALALGLLTLCNHAARPRARVERDFTRNMMGLIALEDIAAGDEVTIDYGCPLWFEAEE
jgi:SET domain-containing protein